MNTSDASYISPDPRSQAVESNATRTIGLDRSHNNLLSWAHEVDVELPLLLLLDASRCDTYPLLTGTALAYLQQRTTLDCLLDWEVELPYLTGLLALADACAVSPYISKAYPPMPSEHSVARQLQGGELGQLPLIALLARPIPRIDPAGERWLACLRSWCFVQFLRSLHSGTSPSPYLIKVVNKLRQAIDEESEWLDLFIRLRGPTASFHTLTRHLSNRATSLLSDTSTPVDRPSHRTMLAQLRNFCDGKEPEGVSDPAAPGYGLFARYLQQPDIRSRWLDVAAAEPSSRETADAIDFTDLDLGTLEFDLPDGEPATLQVTGVENSDTPPEQERRSNGVLLAAVEDCQLLPFSWNRPNPCERRALEQCLDESFLGNDVARQELAALVYLAIQSACSLRTVLQLQLSTELGEYCRIDVPAGMLHRRPPRRYHGWRSTAKTDTWVAPRAERISLDLPVAVHTALVRLVGAAVEGVTLETVWTDRADMPEQIFRNICQTNPGLERVTSGMLAHWLEQAVYENSGDPVLSRLLASHPRSGLPGACAYPSYELEKVHAALRFTVTGSADRQADHPSEILLNGAGSELSPIESLLRQACADALLEVNRLASDPAQWPRHHNALTAYVVVTLLACTGARPVSSPFESLEHIDLSKGHLYIEDKVASRLHQGRLLPLPDAALTLLRDHYLPHLARLAQVLQPFDSRLSQACESMSCGESRQALPLFFLLSTSPELNWVEVSESSLSAVGIFRWPLPWNLMRHRLPTELKRTGLDHEIINGLTGHGEQGTAAYGPYSMRVWSQDAQQAKPVLTQLLQRLELGAPIEPDWPVTSATPVAPPSHGSALGDVQDFGLRARRQRRQETQAKVEAQATREIELFVGGRPLDSIAPDEWEQLSRSMLLTPNGLPLAMGTMRYDTLRQWIVSRWAAVGQQPKLKHRYLPALEEASPFTEQALGADHRWRTAQQQQLALLASRVSSKTSQRDGLAMGIASLMLQSRVADPAVLQDLLQGRNFRLLAFNGSAFLEHAPGLDREPKAPCRRYRMDGAAAVLLAKARTGSYRIDIADRPVPTELQQIAHACGIHASTETTTRQWVQAWLPLVQQCNQMSFPGVVSAYLNGQLVTAALHHADWLRVHRGLAFQLPALNHNTPDKASEDEAWTTDAQAESGDYVFMADELTAPPTADTRNANATGPTDPEEEAVRTAQRRSRAFFQAIRDALNRFSAQKHSPRRDLDAALRHVITEHRDVSRSCRLLAEWLRSLLWRRTSQGQISLRSLSRYLNALSVCFEAVAYHHDLLACDADEVTAFYAQVMEARRTIRPASTPLTVPPSADTDTSTQTDLTAKDGNAPYKTWNLAFQLLRNFHQLMSRELAVEDPDWSEISPAEEVLSISPGMILEREYLHALALAAPSPDQASREELAVAFILLAAMRFGLRGTEVTGLMRGDWVDTLHNPPVVLVQSHRHRTLKTPAARRQVPLLFSLTEQEHLIIDRFLALWEGLSGGNRRVPLFTSSDDASRLLNERLLRWHASQLIKRATLNPNLSLHHARHSFANRVALMLMDRTEGIWPFAAEFDATQNTHVRRLLLCTDQVTRRSLWALARLLGHAHPQTSVRSYLHLLPELADQHVWADAPRSARSVAWDVPGMVQLEGLAPMAGYLNAQERPEQTAPRPPNAQELLRLLYLYHHGANIARAAFSVAATRASATRLVGLVAHADAVLARRKDINIPRGGVSNLLSHIRQPRWQQLMQKAREIETVPDRVTEPHWNEADLLTMIGPSRQILLYQRPHFAFMQQVLKMWGLPQDSVCMLISRERHERLLQWADEFGLAIEPPRTRGAPVVQLDTVEVGDPPARIQHRCAILAVTGQGQPLESSYELVLLVLISIFLLSPGGGSEPLSSHETILMNA